MVRTGSRIIRGTLAVGVFVFVFVRVVCASSVPGCKAWPKESLIWMPPGDQTTIAWRLGVNAAVLYPVCYRVRGCQLALIKFADEVLI